MIRAAICISEEQASERGRMVEKPEDPRIEIDLFLG